MANKVVEDNEIFLNGVYYPVVRPVQSSLASIYPAKIVIGDTTRDSNLRSSVIAWSDWRGGIGVESYSDATNRSSIKNNTIYAWGISKGIWDSYSDIDINPEKVDIYALGLIFF